MLTEQRFIDRIWKRIYRNNMTCQCNTCKDVEANWLIVHDNNHAKYLYATYCDFNSEWSYIEYHDGYLTHKEIEDELWKPFIYKPE